MKQRFGLHTAVSIIITILLVAACKPFGGKTETNEALPTLAPRDVQAVADAEIPVLLPTLVPYPTADPAAVTQPEQTQPDSNPFVPQTTEAQSTEDNGVAVAQAPASPFGNLPGVIQSDDFNTNGDETQPFLPPGMTEEQLNAGTGGTVSQDAGVPTDSSSPFGNQDSALTGFSGNPFGDDSSGGGDFGDLPFDPGVGPGGGFVGFEGLPFGAISTSRYYISTDQPVSLFACAESTCDVVGSLQANDPIDIVDQDGQWVEIKFQGGTAFVYNGFVAEREPLSEDPFGAGVGDFPFGDNPSGDFPFTDDGSGFPFQDQNPTASSSGSVRAGQYNQGSGFSIGRGFSVGGNPLYDEPANNNTNNFNGDSFPWDDNFFDPGNTTAIGSDCPPFLTSC